MQAVEAPIVVDVRLPTEWMALRIGEVLNIPLNELPTGAKALDKRRASWPSATAPTVPASPWGCSSDSASRRRQSEGRQRGVDRRRPAGLRGARPRRDRDYGAAIHRSPSGSPRRS